MTHRYVNRISSKVSILICRQHLQIKRARIGVTAPKTKLLAGLLERWPVDSLTHKQICVLNVIDTNAGSTTRRSKGGGSAGRRCSSSPSTKCARPSLRRRTRILRRPRPRAGQVRNATTPSGRGAAGRPCGRGFRCQSTGLLCRRSGLPAGRDSRTVATSPRASAQSQMHRGGPRFRRALACWTRCARAGNHAAGGPPSVWNYRSSPFSRSSPGAAQKKTRDHPPIGLTARVADGRYLQNQYEALRREALEEDWGERGHGMALFLARGMSAWVGAVQALAPSASNPQPCADDAVRPSGPTLSLSYRAELTTLLAGMVLACSGGKEEAVE